MLSDIVYRIEDIIVHLHCAYFQPILIHSIFLVQDGRQEPRGGRLDRRLPNPRAMSKKNHPDENKPDSRYTHMVTVITAIIIVIVIIIIGHAVRTVPRP